MGCASPRTAPTQLSASRRARPNTNRVADIEAASSQQQVAKHQQAQGPDCFLWFCRLVNVVTGVSGILCLVAFCMSIFIGPTFAEREHLKQQLLRVYGVAFSATLVLVEFEWAWFLAWVKVRGDRVGASQCEKEEACGRVGIQYLVAATTVVVVASAPCLPSN